MTVIGLRIIEREPGGLVYMGELGRELAEKPDEKEIAAVAMFRSLPADLSFPLVEYERMLEAARKAREARPGIVKIIPNTTQARKLKT